MKQYDSEKLIATTPEVKLDVYPHSSAEEAAQDAVVSAENNDHDVQSDLHLQFKNINNIIKEKDVGSLLEFGGAPGFAEALGTDMEKGIPEDDRHCCFRQIASKTFNLPPATSKRLIFLSLFRSSNNYIMLLLLLSAILSIGFGIEEEGLRTGWCEGVILLNAFIILLIFPIIRDLLNSLCHLKGQQKLLEEKEMAVDVVRGGTKKKISTSEISLGDVVCLKRGYQIPADGLFVSGDFLELDDKAVVNAANPFLFYGAEVINGEGRMLVTAVGENTAWAEMMSAACHHDFKKMPFQDQLDKINTWKQIIGLLISVFIIVVLFLRFELTKQRVKSGMPDIKGKPITVNEFKDVIKRIVTKPNGKISSLILSLTMLLVGVVEGLPFCITLAIAYWRRTGMTFAQELSACVAMGSVTAICTDRAGGLTLEPLEVDKFLIGEAEITNESAIASNVGEAIRDGISSTLLLPRALRTETDEPLLSWAMIRFRLKLEALRRSCATILQVRELIEDEEEKGLLMTKNNGDTDTTMCMHCRGPATKILPRCSRYYNNEGILKDMDDHKRLEFNHIVEQMESAHLKVIAFAYKQTVAATIEENDLTLLGLFSLKMSIREDIKEAIKACKRAGVRIILVSKDDVETLVAIAQKFGILDNNLKAQEVITGHDFRNLKDDEERMKIVSGISVMGNSLPSDKHLLVNLLKKNGDSLAVIGIGTNDVPAVKAADVGLALGSWSTNVARASANIIMWDTNISILFPMLRYGRFINNNIQNYIKLELTMLVSGLLIASITIAFTGNMPITTIQSSWVNMLVPLLGGLALLTEPPSEKLMDQPSERNEAVVTKAMWIYIISQAICQATILVTFQFKGQAILGTSQKVNRTIIFNSFVLCQLFNQFNTRELVLKNMFRAMFWVAFGVALVLQLIFIEIAHLLGDNSRLNWPQWCICFLIGLVPMAIDWAEKFILGFIKA
ncbi:calcium-transporting ATPase 12, plasma membrane-type-like [Humulus lupulus]|uniref:calcium-transporting ATPase 12, plasma membrane-type-like n=1 Tax=Humulus lupulus TaxID=3486 RepID=UPI002B413348|nr:calcium-transporting ATPase 12, plasma membrane-type-like [Humulus lupulus]